MAIPVPIAKIGVGSGGSNAWKVSFNATDKIITIGYGTMSYNGKFFTTDDITGNPKPNNGIGKSNTVSDDATGKYVYLRIENPLSVPQETSDSLKIKINVISSSTPPNGDNAIDKDIAPLITNIPLAFVDSEGKVYDLRPAFQINNFSFLAPGQTI